MRDIHEGAAGVEEVGRWSGVGGAAAGVVVSLSELLTILRESRARPGLSLLRGVHLRLRDLQFDASLVSEGLRARRAGLQVLQSGLEGGLSLDESLLGDNEVDSGDLTGGEAGVGVGVDHGAVGDGHC